MKESDQIACPPTVRWFVSMEQALPSDLLHTAQFSIDPITSRSSHWYESPFNIRSKSRDDLLLGNRYHRIISLSGLIGKHLFRRRVPKPFLVIRCSPLWSTLPFAYPIIHRQRPLPGILNLSDWALICERRKKGMDDKKIDLRRKDQCVASSWELYLYFQVRGSLELHLRPQGLWIPLRLLLQGRRSWIPAIQAHQQLGSPSWISVCPLMP